MDCMDNMTFLLNLGAGNPGALTVIRQLLQLGIDGIESLTTLTKLNIKGSLIWMLYKDICSQDIYKFTSILASYNNDKFTVDTLIHAINNYGDGGDGLDITEY